MSQVIHEYRNDNRTATVRLTSEGFEVDLAEDNVIIETRQVHNHSESYAEDVADNYVLGVFDAKKKEKEGSFYGYRERTDNYYPGDD
jgi:hypothetical protein